MSDLDRRFFDRNGCLDHEKAARAGRTAQAQHIAAGLRAYLNFMLGTSPSGGDTERGRSRLPGLTRAGLMTQTKPYQA